MRYIISVLLVFFSGVAVADTDLCTYSTYTWNIFSKKAENFTHVRKPYSDLLEEEIDASTGCSLCQEDQVEILIDDVPPFKVCKYVATDIKTALEESIALGQTVINVVGYRVGKTKGKVDQQGNRTQYSHHSFGTAIDVNPEYNGLYKNCVKYNASCILIKGGAWSPHRLESLTADSHLVRILKTIGFKWGGEIRGKQKDFMHFSHTGY